MEEIVKALAEQAGSGIAAGIFGGLAWAVYRLKKWFIKKKERYSVTKLVQTDVNVYTFLSELMIETGAVRAFVFQFHNGTFYLNASNSMKMSCTHEVVREGISREGEKMQNMLISQYSATMAEIVSKPVAIINVDETTFKYYFVQLLRSQGVKLAVFSSLINENAVEGFIGIAYSDLQETDFAVEDVNTSLVRAYASRIGYLLRDGFNEKTD